MEGMTDAEFVSEGWQLGALQGLTLVEFLTQVEPAIREEFADSDDPLPEHEWTQSESGIRAEFADGSVILIGHGLVDGEWRATGGFTTLTFSEWERVAHAESCLPVEWAEADMNLGMDVIVGVGGAVGFGAKAFCSGCGSDEWFLFSCNEVHVGIDFGWRCLDCAEKTLLREELRPQFSCSNCDYVTDDEFTVAVINEQTLECPKCRGAIGFSNFSNAAV